MQTIDVERLKIGANQTLLDLGCGEGRHALAASWLCPEAHVVAVDLSEHDVCIARTRQREWAQPKARQCCYFAVADGLQLPFAEHTFDAVICSEVLEHVEHYEQLLGEIHRVLKPGGQLAISVPRAWPEKICWRLSRAYHEVEGGHIRIFNAARLRANIEHLAFRFTGRHWAHALHTPYWWLRCLFWRNHEQIAAVRWYHKLLVWDLMQKPWLTQYLEKCLNPLIGKSIVMYFVKEADPF